MDLQLDIENDIIIADDCVEDISDRATIAIVSPMQQVYPLNETSNMHQLDAFNKILANEEVEIQFDFLHDWNEIETNREIMLPIEGGYIILNLSGFPNVPPSTAMYVTPHGTYKMQVLEADFSNATLMGRNIHGRARMETGTIQRHEFFSTSDFSNDNSSETVVTNVLSDQPIMSAVEAPTSNKIPLYPLHFNDEQTIEENATKRNLEDSLAAIGIATQPSAFCSSLELPLTVTNPEIALDLSATSSGTTLDRLTLQCRVSETTMQLSLHDYL